MDVKTLAAVMGNQNVDYSRYVGAVNKALADAGCTTVDRVAMWCAQIGHESVGLARFRELYDGDKVSYFTRMYEWNSNLGNDRVGDGARFYGRGAIQVTGRYNYTTLSSWAHSKGYVPTPTYFVDNPGLLETDEWAFVGAVWYWTVARSMNDYADRGDIRGASIAVNGGTNGLDDRIARWNRCRAMGDALLPSSGGNMADAQSLVLDQLSGFLGQGWEILGRSKVDPSRFNTLVEAVAEIRDALLKPEASVVNPNVAFALADFVRFTDAASYRTELAVEKLTKAVADLAKKVG